MEINYNEKIDTVSSYKNAMGVNKKSKKIVTAYSEGKTWKVDLTDIFDGKNEIAYREACENRRFEIEMYWKRAGYFWAFIMSIYTAFFTISAETKEFPHKHSFLVVLAFLGFIFCLGFYFANKGSKNWQENWEQHVNLLENEVSGRLYKTFIRDENSYSVSKINDFLSFVLSIFSGGFFIVQTVDFLKIHFEKLLALQKLGFFIIVLAVAILVFLYMKFCLLGNQAGSKDFNFVSAEVDNGQ